jgi:hypothetical protein
MRGQSDRFGGELGSLQVGAGGARVALVEDQIQHSKDRVEALNRFASCWQRERDPTVVDRPLGSGNPSGHGSFGHEEGSGDLGGGETANCSEGQRYLRCD